MKKFTFAIMTILGLALGISAVAGPANAAASWQQQNSFDGGNA